MFGKILEWIQNIGKHIHTKKLSNSKQMRGVQNIQIKVWKYKVVECLDI